MWATRPAGKRRFVKPGNQDFRESDLGHPPPGSEWSDCVETIEPYGDSNPLYGGTKMKSNMNADLEDVPMAYFWYPFLAIVAMVVAAVVVVIKMV